MLPENILRLFFSDLQFQKLLIIHYLHNTTLQVPVLEKELKVSKKKVKRAINSIQLDIIDYNDKNRKELLLIADKNVVHLSKNIKDEDYVQLLQYIREKYLLSSSLYNSLLFTLEKRNFTVMELANKLSYSESYTYKLVKKIEKFFLLMDLGISILKKSDKILCLSGDEVVMRLLHYLLINIISSEKNWYFQTISKSQIETIHSFVNSKRVKHFSPSNLKKVNIIMAVYEVAIRNGYVSAELPDSVRSVGRILNKEKELPMYLTYLQKRELGEIGGLYDELIQLAFILNYFTRELRTKNEKIVLGKELVNNNRNKIINPCILLINQICEKYTLTEESYFLLVYSICNHFIVIHYLKLYKFMKFDKFQLRNQKTELIVPQIKESVSATQDNYNNFEQMPNVKKIDLSGLEELIGYGLFTDMPNLTSLNLSNVKTLTSSSFLNNNNSSPTYVDLSNLITLTV
ncbi:helix-turn-helix domain-containing protein [Enterococcus faecalis]|uniref:helix-turn-helix domain-containing protein n=1 Tax=Enterococcus faecalis TaxID=1351 RepID=UPI003CC57B36